MIKRFTLALSLVTISAITFGQAYSGPESVDFSTAYGLYFISNSTSDILQRDASGTLSYFGSASGSHGLEVIGDTLFALEGGSIKGYQIPSGTQVINVNLGGSFLNGITHKGDDIFITDFSANKIYRMNRWTLAYNVYINSTPSTPNGIIYDDISDRLVCVSWGSSAKVYEIDMSDSTMSIAASTTYGNMDGIAMDCQGNFYISTWSPNRIIKFDNSFSTGPTDMGATGLSSPADIYYNRTTDTLAIPNSGNNTVTFEMYVSCVTGVEDEEVQLDFSISPNPANDNAVIQLASASDFVGKIEVIDVKGSVVEQHTVSITAGQNTIPINVNELEAGVYFVKFQAENQSQARKLVVR